MATENRVSMLIALIDQPGALQAALEIFTRMQVNLTHIESRPAKDGYFDFYVDCEGEREDKHIAATITALGNVTQKLLILDNRSVPWFPRHIAELDQVVGNTLEAGSELGSDHPGFNDQTYRERRAFIKRLAENDKFGAAFPMVEYTQQEISTWHEVYSSLEPLHARYACREYLDALHDLKSHCAFDAGAIPQGADINQFLQARTGFRLRPVAGLLSSRDFLNGLAFRVFFSTQYIRHRSRPAYTPEPDICHEFLGHVPMFADPAFAQLSEEIGLASLGASDAEIARLARCYWFSVEFGLVREGGAIKAYGAGLLSSPGELVHACESGHGERKSWHPALAAEQPFPITDFQETYFVADTLGSAKQLMGEYARCMQRPFHARYNAAAQRIWVDRAIEREKQG